MKLSYIRLNDAVDYIQGLIGIRVPKNTLYDWSRRGKTSYDGQRIKLNTTMRFGMIYTTEEWIKKFLEQVG